MSDSKNQTNKQEGKNSSDVVKVQGLISFILFIIPEVIMSQHPENYNIRGCYSSSHSAQCANAKWSRCNYNFHAWEGSFFEVSWKGSEKREKKISIVTDKRRMKNMFQPETPLLQNLSASIHFLKCLQLLTVEGASVMQIRIMLVTRLFILLYIVVDSFPTQVSIVTSRKQLPGSVTAFKKKCVLLSHTAVINNLSPQINNNQRWKGNMAPRMNLWRIKAPFLIWNQRHCFDLKFISV